MVDTKEPKGERKIHWDDSKMQTTYANVVNATSTREEVSLFFGTNQTWNPTTSQDVTIQLTDRMVLNPYAAKRLAVLLSGILSEYEKRFGDLPIDPQSGH
jgi:hypothetical protein